ncbi:MAG: hypothetical protein HXX08_09500 [Chloroflexi bacterium]|uniref:Uncharacterized protein n=1 Tax=Candidatus Chlorohelix allophototropha TaxID=3003348 RepID=A0A8T7M1U6_9CHLR|nr:hypothetical protein [Chloroflexota bacterium]WJW65479.1 hypothetical protein OZ401_001244 [Chloroflexota bacterium L227-S17]
MERKFISHKTEKANLLNKSSPQQNASTNGTSNTILTIRVTLVKSVCGRKPKIGGGLASLRERNANAVTKTL